MKTLIAYATKHGSTEECAKALAAKSDSAADLCNLKETKHPDLSNYDKVIIGGSIYAGRIQKEVTEFCKNQLQELEHKKLGFYICGMIEGEPGQKQLFSAFPSELLEQAFAKENFGGRIAFTKLGFFEKTIVKKVAKIQSDFDKLSESKIDQFAQLMNQA